MARQRKGQSRTPTSIEVRGARVHNLTSIDVDIPLGESVAIAGVSGSGKSSLAMGVLFAEGSRRYIEALSTYTRRRMAQAPRADVDQVRHVPAALALRQQPGVPSMRSTFGTSTELLNVVRLMFSRLGEHLCPNGHRQDPTWKVAAEQPLVCPQCDAQFHPPGAEELAFNSAGACPTCTGTGTGTGTVHEVDDAALIRDETLSIDDGTVIPWQMYGFNVQPQIAREFGVRTDVPFSELADWERDIVFDGPEEKKHITVTTRNGVHELDFTFRNARLTVTKELQRAEDGKRLDRVRRFLIERTCPACQGTRLSETARAPQIAVANLAEITALTLDDATKWASSVASSVPGDMRSMARSLTEAFEAMARLCLVTGVSGSGKTTLMLDSLVPALQARDAAGRPRHVAALEVEEIDRVAMVDATPIGVNVRSTVATYSGVLDDLRRDYARLEAAQQESLKPGDFSYNTGSLRCPVCEGTGQISLDVQFLPDVDITCPDCEGSRYDPDADRFQRPSATGEGELSLPQLLALTVAEAIDHVRDLRKVASRLESFIDVGLGYLTLNEATPSLSGGEAQRLKLVSELHRSQKQTVFVLDEPTVGLHPLDVRTLIEVLQRLLDRGATVIVIEHDLDLIANADHIIDMGPAGGIDGGRIVATGTPEQIAADAASVTGRYLQAHLTTGG